jgi:hypothetical protein
LVIIDCLKEGSRSALNNCEKHSFVDNCYECCMGSLNWVKR